MEVTKGLNSMTSLSSTLTYQYPRCNPATNRSQHWAPTWHLPPELPKLSYGSSSTLEVVTISFAWLTIFRCGFASVACRVSLGTTILKAPEHLFCSLTSHLTSHPMCHQEVSLYNEEDVAVGLSPWNSLVSQMPCTQKRIVLTVTELSSEGIVEVQTRMQSPSVTRYTGQFIRQTN